MCPIRDLLSLSHAVEGRLDGLANQLKRVLEFLLVVGRRQLKWSLHLCHFFLVESWHRFSFFSYCVLGWWAHFWYLGCFLQLLRGVLMESWQLVFVMWQIHTWIWEDTLGLVVLWAHLAKESTWARTKQLSRLKTLLFFVRIELQSLREFTESKSSILFVSFFNWLGN